MYHTESKRDIINFIYTKLTNLMNQVTKFDNMIIADEKNHTHSDITLSSDVTWEGVEGGHIARFVKKAAFRLYI